MLLQRLGRRSTLSRAVTPDALVIGSGLVVGAPRSGKTMRVLVPLARAALMRGISVDYLDWMGRMWERGAGPALADVVADMNSAGWVHVHEPGRAFTATELPGGAVLRFRGADRGLEEHYPTGSPVDRPTLCIVDTSDAPQASMGDLALAYASVSANAHVGMLSAVNTLNVLKRRADGDARAILGRSATTVFLYNSHRDDPDLLAAAGGIDPETTAALPVGQALVTTDGRRTQRLHAPLFAATA
ncbi:hypothetical protein [Nonomuraea sp. NPDC049784]|uniref:hypothetical protein n=1 Tax=Nonomuraea sp. NPDC049784 TaxID=3154361 RepID=UPI0033EA37B3